MRRKHLSFLTIAIGISFVIAMFAAVSAWGQSHSTKRPTATVITVTAGKPTELGFKLSKFSNIPAGTVTFKVTNQGLAFHSFKLCTTPVATAAKNSCTGVVTKILKHGQSATLTVKLTKTGKYEFLCTVPGHASAGMKGLLGIGVAVKATTTAKTTSSTTTTAALTGGGSSSTTTTASGGATSGNNAPPSGPDGCPGGTSIQANLITTGGDGDVDDSGGQSDMDGCV